MYAIRSYYDLPPCGTNHRCTKSLDLPFFPVARLLLLVITSYSIHYTKLYDKGKGAPEGFVAPIAPGRIIIEAEGVPFEMAKEALRLAALV